MPLFERHRSLIKIIVVLQVLIRQFQKSKIKVRVFKYAEDEKEYILQPIYHYDGGTDLALSVFKVKYNPKITDYFQFSSAFSAIILAANFYRF